MQVQGDKLSNVHRHISVGERDVDDQIEQQKEEQQHEMSKLCNVIYVL